MNFYFLFRKEETIDGIPLKNKYVKAVFQEFPYSEEIDRDALTRVRRHMATEIFLQQFKINPDSGSIVSFTQDEWDRCHTAELICFATMNCFNKTVLIEEGKTDSEFVVEVTFSLLTTNN